MSQALSQPKAFAQAVQYILEAVMFENWMRFYFITEKPGSDNEDKLFIAVPEQGMQRMEELYPHLLPLAQALNGKEIDFETSRSAVCTYVVTEVDGKRVPRNMSDMVFDSATFQTELQLFNTWVQAHEEQLDQNFMEFGQWRKLFAEWRSSEQVKDWAAKMNAAGLQGSAADSDADKGTVQ